MKLVSVQITRYRSAEDSGLVGIEPDVTCLVGKNESGKTNILQALLRLNPADQGAVLDEVLDYPARLTRERRDAPADKQIPVVVATFRYDQGDVDEIEQELGLGALLSREFTVTKGYRTPALTIGHRWEEKAIARWLASQVELVPAAAAAVTSQETLRGLLGALDALPEAPQAAQDLAARIRAISERGIGGYLVDKFAWPRLPKFVYFADYDSMPAKISIPDLIARRDAGTLERGEQALLSLLSKAAVKPEDFLQVDQHERLIRSLEIAGNDISDEVFKYWTQNKELEVKLQVLQPETGAVPPLNQGPILEIRVYNKKHRVSVQFSERSRGFVWFFSFLSYFTELEHAATSDLILLLDEPGLSLHGRAQHDLLDLIDDRLAPRHQVIYTTHSPFMVAADHLDRVRTVIDLDDQGTVVSSEIFKADQDTTFPLMSAMGFELTQSLFVGPHCLLLEGPSDLIYLDVFSDLAAGNGLPGLDTRWVKIPVGGAGKLSTFVALLGANKINVAVLVDSSTTDTGAIRRLRDNGRLAASGLIGVGEFTGTTDADIEDLFDRDFYLRLVSIAYENELPGPLTATNINSADPRVVRAIEVYFRDNNINGEKFDHYRPAALLLRRQTELLPHVGQATITRAAQLIGRINVLLP